MVLKTSNNSEGLVKIKLVTGKIIISGELPMYRNGKPLNDN